MIAKVGQDDEGLTNQPVFDERSPRLADMGLQITN